MTSNNDEFKECLSDMKQVLDMHNQKFFLTCGTLLGQQREDNFIAHDGDIDLGILSSDFLPGIATKIANTQKFSHVRVLGELTKSRELNFRHNNGVNIDLFVYYPCDDGSNKSNYYYYASFFGLCDTKPEGFCKWGRHIDGFKDVGFMGETYKVPSNTEQYLVEEYGEDWRTPKEFGYLEGLHGDYKNMIN